MMMQKTPSHPFPSYQRFAQAMSPLGTRPFRVGIVIGPGFLPMDMVGIQAVFGFCPGAEIHLLWNSLDLVEGFLAWWTKPTTAFSDCPEKLDVLAVPMLAPETTNDSDVIAFVAKQGRQAQYVIGVCNGVVLLGAAGLLQGKRVTTSLNSLTLLKQLEAAEVVTSGGSVVVDGNLYTARPSIGSFEAALLVAEVALGREFAELANLIVEYDSHPPLGPGTVENAGKAIAEKYSSLIADMIQEYSRGAIAAYSGQAQG